MHISELPRLKDALDLMGLDNGANVNLEAIIPAEYEGCALAAEAELLQLPASDVETLAQGEETEQQDIAKSAPYANEFLNLCFDDGPMANIMFEPWRNIFDARASERRYARKGLRDRSKGED